LVIGKDIQTFVIPIARKGREKKRAGCERDWLEVLSKGSGKGKDKKKSSKLETFTSKESFKKSLER
jgi:hypothetical protein